MVHSEGWKWMNLSAMISWSIIQPFSFRFTISSVITRVQYLFVQNSIHHLPFRWVTFRYSLDYHKTFTEGTDLFLYCKQLTDVCQNHLWSKNEDKKFAKIMFKNKMFMKSNSLILFPREKILLQQQSGKSTISKNVKLLGSFKLWLFLKLRLAEVS